ncbi:hypothetical protein [Glycomyces sp. NRRL B-16210]|uniref:hypothetical protein n=1 Tax=Glycomyces sp. NRRL B-16210 TaxID=1463821 RepID=UPI000691831B|nr:hypothetical protein [Glycomyces sp. NRRL B-16210]
MRHLSGRLLAAAAVVPIAVLASAAPAQAQSQPFDAPAEAAASWLAAQSDGTSWSEGDVSSSLDAVIALQAAGVGGDQIQATLEWLNDTDTLTPYVFAAAEGDDEAALNAGPTGKVMYAVATAGGDPTNFAGIRLADELAAAQAENGTYGDGTALSTAWAVLGLSRTDAPAGEEAAAGLAAVQCEDGGFSWGSVDGVADCFSDPDSTGLVVAALAALEGEAAAEPLDAAVSWLESAQAEDGGFDGGFGENANSTAMAAQALLAVDRDEAAASAVAFLIELQFDCDGDAPGAVRYSEPEDPEYGEASRLLATAQAIVPLAGQNLADLDAANVAAELPAGACESAGDGEGDRDGEEAGAAQDEESSNSWLPWVVGAAVVVLAALIVGFALKARNSGGAAPAGNGESDGTSNDGATDDGADK